ncbi:MAG TPA: glycosyltransferase [Methanolinea sp.]|nr:glycosyltransferase [Methanolinea sp.]
MSERVANPILSVIMPVFNAEKYLSQAIESILNQTFKDFELIIIDDNSTDNTRHIIQSYHDNRIIYIINPIPLGLQNSLNQGLKIAKGDYIARMDADDISDANRFLKQITFLKKNPEIGICGSWIEVIDENNNILHKVQLPIKSTIIAWHLFFGDCIAHPTVIFRRSIKEYLNYDSNFTLAEDYELWIRLIKKIKFENIPEYLLKYRIHQTNMSANIEKINYYNFIIRKNAIENLLNCQLSDLEINAIREWTFQFPTKNARHIKIIGKIIAKMYQFYLKSTNLTKKDRREINFITAYQYLQLASCSLKISLYSMIICIIYGIKYYPLIFIYPILRRIKNW